jgi:uncharacterized RDD family membrane protein YckC
VAITVLKNNVPWGPFTRPQIEEGLQRGDFTLRYLAYTAGLKDWLPLGEVLHFLDAGAKLPPLPETSALPPLPETSPSPPALPPTPEKTAPISLTPPEKNPRPLEPPLVEKVLPTGPFFPRFIAFVIDACLLFVPPLLFFGLSALIIWIEGWWERTDAETMHQHWSLLGRNLQGTLLLIALGLAWFYAAGLESSRWQATIGKKWMGLKVTDMQGERLGFLHASGRHAAKYLSALPCFLGFVAALFNSRRLALHDRIAGTRVLRR